MKKFIVIFAFVISMIPSWGGDYRRIEDLLGETVCLNGTPLMWTKQMKRCSKKTMYLNEKREIDYNERVTSVYGIFANNRDIFIAKRLYNTSWNGFDYIEVHAWGLKGAYLIPAYEADCLLPYLISDKSKQMNEQYKYRKNEAVYKELKRLYVLQNAIEIAQGNKLPEKYTKVTWHRDANGGYKDSDGISYSSTLYSYLSEEEYLKAKAEEDEFRQRILQYTDKYGILLTAAIIAYPDEYSTIEALVECYGKDKAMKIWFGKVDFGWNSDEVRLSLGEPKGGRLMINGNGTSDDILRYAGLTVYLENDKVVKIAYKH